MLLFVLYYPGPLTVIYNMYKSMTSCGVHLYPLFVLYSIYIHDTPIMARQYMIQQYVHTTTPSKTST